MLSPVSFQSAITVSTSSRQLFQYIAVLTSALSMHSILNPVPVTTSVFFEREKWIQYIKFNLIKTILKSFNQSLFVGIGGGGGVQQALQDRE